MHIHLPKPLHGWRAFLGEVAIIVLGVLIALGFEQLAEAVHDRSHAREARETIGAEVVTDITRIEQRDNNAGCVDARLAELDMIIDGAGPDGRIRRPSWIGAPPRYGIESTRWTAASQSGRVSLLPSDWQSQFGLIYLLLAHYGEQNLAEQLVWARLDALAGVDRLTQDGKLAIKADIALARFYNDSMHQESKQLFADTAKVGLAPRKRRDPPFSVCWPLTTPSARGRAMVVARFSR